MRLSDIRAALQDQGFRIEVDRGFAAQPTTEERPVAAPNELDHLLVASHPRGADRMQMWLFVEGRRHSTQRQARVAGGLRYTSTFESGELWIHLGGTLAGDSEGVIYEMNRFQVALRDRFERVRAKR
jgi:hypothetical protein